MPNNSGSTPQRSPAPAAIPQPAERVEPVEPVERVEPVEPVDVPDVADVTIERTSTVTVTFDDGLVCIFDVADLRAACPCATCRGVRERGGAVWPPSYDHRPIEIRDAAFTGAWGISIVWNDGHDTGIYAWANLRRWWLGGLSESIENPIDPTPIP